MAGRKRPRESRRGEVYTHTKEHTVENDYALRRGGRRSRSGVQKREHNRQNAKVRLGTQVPDKARLVNIGRVAVVFVTFEFSPLELLFVSSARFEILKHDFACYKLYELYVRVP